MNTHQASLVRTQTKPPPSFTPVPTGLLQRKCTCGGTLSPAGECEACRKKKLERRPGNLQAPSSIDHSASVISELQPVVNEVLRSSRQLLPKEMRVFKEPRFGHDFSQVRLHYRDALQLAQERNGRIAEHQTFDPRSNFDRIPVTVPLIQRKPIISSPGDRLEREADDVADRVMRMVESGPIGGAQARLQHKGKGCEENSRATAAQQSSEGGKGEEENSPLASQAVVHRKAESKAPACAVAMSSHTIADWLAGAKSGGELLAAGTRHSMETAFGRDFSRVRVHHDSEAAELSHQLSALAFTHGNHIYFGGGRFDPERLSGKRLLAHELAHVVQQGQAARMRGGDTVPAAAIQAIPPAIQRVATWAAPAVHETNNLANTVLNGVAVGVTAPMFNGVILATAAGARAALNDPTVTVSPAASGGFDATVTTVPTNTGSADETVLAPGPWRLPSPKATIGALFPSLTQCTGAGNSTFRARGDPSDAAMFAANRRHEDHHATDGNTAFNSSVVPWDARLTTANTAGTTFHGASEAAARAALFTAMRGTRDQVSDAFVAAWIAARDLFHTTPAGGPVGPSTDPTAAPDCSWSFVRKTNPS